MEMNMLPSPSFSLWPKREKSVRLETEGGVEGCRKGISSNLRDTENQKEGRQ